jgi:transcriptional regulator with XRE-family HTH domain
MAYFHRDKLEMFLGVIRKYMQVRGQLSQKELAELAGVGVSTMSRFLSMKTSELNPQLIAKITAKLNIPLHEMIDFVDEDSADDFIRHVKFFKEEAALNAPLPEVRSLGEEDPTMTMTMTKEVPAPDFEEEVLDTLAPGGGTAKRNATARVNVGGKKRNISFEADNESPNSELSIREKLESLSPRQKGFMSDFLNLDMEGRDLMVDIGASLLRYFRHDGKDF